jgi:hypothetical protein
LNITKFLIWMLLKVIIKLVWMLFVFIALCGLEP